MKKLVIVALYGLGVFILSDCSSSKKVAAPVKLTYSANVAAILENHCAPCHIPAKGGNKRSYDNYANVKADIEDILRRVQLEPNQRGYMPARQPKLSDSTIAVLKQWQTDGLLEQ